jgi:hypothetical protein
MLIAEALDGVGKTESAVNELEAAARISPKEPVLHFELGYWRRPPVALQNLSQDWDRLRVRW